MALKFSATISTGFEPVAEGEYEVKLSAEWKKTSTGDTYIGCAYTIRKDVEQEFGGRIIFDGIYKSKTTGDFPQSKINAILSTIPNARVDFENYDEVIQYINGRYMRVKVKIQKADTPEQKDRNVIDLYSYLPTEHRLEEIDIEDSLPF